MESVKLNSHRFQALLFVDMRADCPLRVLIARLVALCCGAVYNRICYMLGTCAKVHLLLFLLKGHSLEFS